MHTLDHFGSLWQILGIALVFWFRSASRTSRGYVNCLSLQFPWALRRPDLKNLNLPHPIAAIAPPALVTACHSLSQLLISFCKRPVKKMLRWHTVCHTVSWYVLVTSLVGTSGASMRLISVIASCFLAVFFPSTILLWFQDRVRLVGRIRLLVALPKVQGLLDFWDKSLA